MPLYRIGQVWYIDLATERGRIRRSTGTTDKRQAQAYYERLRAEQWEHEKLGTPLIVTWGQALKKWVDTKNPGLPDRYRLRRLDAPLSTPLPLSETDVEPAMNNGTKPLSAGSWNRLIGLITVIHKLSNVTPPALRRKDTPSGRTRFLSKWQWAKLQKILKKESPLLEQAARFTLATGLRENNVIELQWAQVDLKRRLAFLYADQVKNRETLGVPLSDAALAVLKERRGENETWVFAHPDSGRPLYKASNRAWYQAVKKAGLKGFRWHDLRHTWASWAVMNGVSLRELMELGGWKTFSMVQRYSHLSKDHLAEAANRVKPV
jgi:integrase